MTVIDAIKARRSIRKYKSTKVPDEVVLKLLDSARLAPSGNNLQPWQFIVVTEPELKKEFQAANHDQEWISSAPLLMVCVADLKSRVKDPAVIKIDENSPDLEVKKIIRDTAIATQHIVLTAEELGLGTCWLAWFDQKDIRPIFGIPEDKYAVAVITVGYADESPKPKPRKDLDEIVHYEKWRER